MKTTIANYFRGDFGKFYRKYLPKTQKGKGSEFMALCPFHDDTKPSFSFNVKTGQYICFGCGAKGDIFNFYGQLHNLNGDFPAVLKSIAIDFGITVEPEQKRKVVKTYDYTDENGKLLHQTVRYDPKAFSQRRPDGHGGWIWNLKDIEPVLYRLSEVLRSPEVIIAEGEKDDDKLAGLGFTATTNPMGAEKWQPSYNEYLRGKDVVLLPDNDEAGRDHMLKVAESLFGIAKSVKILNLPDLPHKGDVSDFIESFPDKETAAERLSILIESCPLWEPPADEPTGLAKAVLTIMDFSNLDIPARKEYLAPWIKEGSIGLISGWRGCGKTYFALGILDAVTTGKAFGPWECKHPATSLLLDGEMPVQDIKERSIDLGLNSERKQPFLIYSDAFAQSQGLNRANLTEKSWRDEMKSYLTEKEVKFWVVDNLASVASGLDENIKQDWDPINQWLLDLRFAGISTLMLHHLGKAGLQRGTSAREDNLDYSVVLKTPPNYTPEDGCRFIVNFGKARVGTRELSQITDIEFKLQYDETGRLIWTWGSVKAETKKDILKLLDEGHTQTEVCDVLAVDKGYVSRIRKQAIKDGLLTGKNELTQSGFQVVNDG